MDKRRILITVKTYPTISNKYGETVCTAGLTEDGQWVRLYPVPFRRLNEAEQYKKYDWVECQIVKQPKDQRPESYRPLLEEELVPVGHIDTSDHWRARKELVLGKARVFDDLSKVIRLAKANEISLAVFKPTKVIALKIEKDACEWDIKKVTAMRELSQQFDLFEDNKWRETFRLIPKIPYKFSYVFEDKNGKSSTLQILDWEIGALYSNVFRSCNDEELAKQKVKEKYLDQFIKTDLHFYLGTTQRWHAIGLNPWVIIGVFPAPKKAQLGLFD